MKPPDVPIIFTEIDSKKIEVRTKENAGHFIEEQGLKRSE